MLLNKIVVAMNFTKLEIVVVVVCVNVTPIEINVVNFRDFLEIFNALPQTPLEIAESVDMMRAVEHGYTVRCIESKFKTVSVDTPDDLRRAASLMTKDPLFKHIFDRQTNG